MLVDSIIVPYDDSQFNLVNGRLHIIHVQVVGDVLSIYNTVSSAPFSAIRLGDPVGGNYTEVESTGVIKFAGGAVVWNDANVGAMTLSLPAVSHPGEVNFRDSLGADTGITTYGFAVGEKISGAIEVPHDYKEGSDLTFHIHWQGIDAPSGTDYVKWQVTYTISRDGVVLGSVVVITGETAFATRYQFKLTNCTTISGSAIKIGDQFLFVLQRVAAAGDAYAGEALVATVGLHYQCDTVGSRQITAK